MSIFKRNKRLGKEVVKKLNLLSDAYITIFNAWYKSTFAGIEVDMLADSQLDMCFKKAEELYTEQISRSGF
jgi:hypothetical protein